ncbi:hypothetical protein [Polyangium jinanense]|uniref:Uncharacterized protein n=1 Tax=Polyangium jinanense TaxID=2829994 RepID=A0A9X3X6H6_9BACT|nr:hypothetical protein [Polyangium jinanense]MDC3956696.1 hypothetical protein [Polyangium jinanense]MDC3984759.1 hypothetical protein [Polyangium jinanense]
MDRALPLCDRPLVFMAILTNWVSVSTFDPPAARTLTVRIRRAPDAAKLADVTIVDEAGDVAEEVHRSYEPATECFEVLYATAFEAAKLLGAFEPPEPPPPPQPPAPPCPPAPPQPQPRPSPPPLPRPPPLPKRFFLGAGVGAFLNVAPEPFLAPRVSAGWNVAPRWVVGLDVAAWPWMTANPQDGPTSVDVETYLGTVAGCYRFGRFMTCGLLAGGVLLGSGTNRLYGNPYASPLLGLGGRVAAEIPVWERVTWRSDVDALGFVLARQLTVNGVRFSDPFPLAMSVTTSLAFTF